MHPFIELGKPFPIPLQQGLFSQLARESFQVVACFPQIKPSLVALWQAAPLQYGVLVQDTIPLFVVQFNDTEIHFDVAFNALLETPENQHIFLQGQHHSVKLVLVRQDDNRVLAVRPIEMDPTPMDALRDACRKQVEAFSAAMAVQQKIASVQAQLSPEDLIAETRFYPAIGPTHRP